MTRGFKRIYVSEEYHVATEKLDEFTKKKEENGFVVNNIYNTSKEGIKLVAVSKVNRE